VPHAVNLYYGLLSCGSGHITTLLKGEEVASFLRKLLAAAKAPGVLRRLMAWWIRGKAPKMAAVLDNLHAKSAGEYYEYVAEMGRYKAEFEAAMRKEGVELLLAPVHALPAVPHNSSSEMTQAACYSFLYNVLDYCAACVPVTTMIEEDRDWPSNSEIAGGAIDSYIEAPMRDAYKKAAATGAAFPCGVQIAGLPFEEEKVVGVLVQLEEALKMT